MRLNHLLRATALALVALAFLNCPRKQTGPRYTIFFTNDLQAHLLPDRDGRGGLARIAYLVKKAKAENPDTILVDAGDGSVGTAFGTETGGEAVFRVMNAAGYDGSIYGNHEFDLGADQARRYQEIAAFPILSCNIRDRDSKPFSLEYKIFKMRNLRLGITGIANPKTETLVDPAGIPGLNFLSSESEIRRIQSELSGRADTLVVLSHQGLKQDLSLAYHLAGIPLIIGGHSEIKLSRMVRANDTYIAQAGHFGWWLGRIDFSWNPETKSAENFQYQLIPVTDRIPEDAETKTAIERELAGLPAGLSRVIGQSRRRLSQDFLGNWIAELLKAEAKADLGIINSAGVRSEIPAGPVTALDIYEIMPFNDRVCAFEIDGAELLRIKSMRWFYFSAGPKISPGKIYRVASIDYLLKVKDYPAAKNPQIFDTLLRDKIIGQVEKDRGFKSPREFP